MAKRLQLRRGTAAEINAFTGAIGEPIYNETYKTIVLHDGVTKGGIALAKSHEIPSLVPQATEDVAGKAKIATTAIAQAGTNDTDIITAKKLRDALSATGNAPMYACRAWASFNGIGVVALNSSGNVSSITDLGVGNYQVNLTVAMPHAKYAGTFSGTLSVNGTDVLFGNIYGKTTTSFKVSTYGLSLSVQDTFEISVGVIC